MLYLLYCLVISSLFKFYLANIYWENYDKIEFIKKIAFIL